MQVNNGNYGVKFIVVAMLFRSFLDIAYAKNVFRISSKTPYLNISSALQADTTAIGPTDFVVFNNTVAVLDSAGCKISFFDFSGHFCKKISLPDGYYQRLMRDKDNNLYAFANHGLQTAVLKITDKKIKKTTLQASLASVVAYAVFDDRGMFLKNSNFNRDKINVSAPYVNGLSYQIKYKNNAGVHPILLIGNKEVKLNHHFPNAGTRIEQIDADGTAWIEQSLEIAYQKAQTYVLKISPAGEVEAIYQLPEIHPDDYVEHQIAISDQGEVWFMRGLPTELWLDKLEPLTESATLLFYEQGQDSKKKIMHRIMAATNDACPARTEILNRGLQYVHFNYCYPLAAVENDASCPARKIPQYLLATGSQCQQAVGYNWGGFDSVDSYSKKLLYMKAGNVNTSVAPLLTCAAGVDCSGLVSKLWGLKSKWGTAQIFSKTDSIDISKLRIGDVLVKPNYHVMLYTGSSNAQIATIEAVARPGKVIESLHPISWFLQHGYTAKKAYNIC